MIKNERQYRITKAQAEKFARALGELRGSQGGGERVHLVLVRAEEEALRSQLDDLTMDLQEYEKLRGGNTHAVALGGFEELPLALIRARIARGLSQKELAERVGLKEQQIQRYEATEYASASMKRMREFIRALNLPVREDEIPAGDVSTTVVFNRLKGVGLDREFILRRLVPRAVAARVKRGKHEEGGLACQVAGLVSRVFGWTPKEIIGPGPLKVDAAVLGGTRFKVPARINELRVSAYTIYAHYLALLVLQATPRLTRHRVRRDAEEVHKTLLSRYGSVTFEAGLDYVWDLGIPVVPLSDPGAFHAACWRLEGRNVIVVKQRSRAPSLWLFDLMHEVWHAGEAPDKKELAVVEEEGYSVGAGKLSEEEAAGEFAGDVILGGRSEELAELCAEIAGGSVARLKGAVQRVAGEEGVPVEGLANYLAFRLAHQGINWWGAAKNLQRASGNPWQLARDRLLREMEVEHLGDVDREILIRALHEQE